MKKIINYFFLFLPVLLHSQKIRGFGSIGTYLDRSFDKSIFVNIGGGLEYKVHENFKPEIEASYFFGSIPDRTEEIEGVTTESLVRVVNATNIAICPKIIFGDDDEPMRFQILPKYNITNSFAQGSFFKLNSSKTDFIKTDSDKFSETRHSFGIGIGVIFGLSDESFQSITLNLYYNNIDIGNALSKLKFNKGIYHTQQSFGIGVNFYLGFVKKNKF